MKRKPRTVLSVVLSEADMEQLDSIAAEQVRSRSNTARVAIRIGMRQMDAARKAGIQ